MTLRHLLIICNEYPPSKHGGIGTVTRELAEGLVNQGVKVTTVGVYNKKVLPIEKPTTEKINNVTVVRLPDCKLPLLSQVRSLFDRIKIFIWILRENTGQHYDLIEVPDYEGMLPFGAPGRIPVVCRGHGSAFYFDAELKRHQASRLVYFFEKMTLKRAGRLVFVSKYTANKTLEIVQLKKKYSVIYNCVDTNYFKPDPSIQREQGLILFVNSIVQKKGVETLFSAIKIVFSGNPEAKLFLLGKSPNPNYPKLLLSMIPEQYHERVHFMGHVNRSEVLHYLQRANVCVFPSFCEAFAMGPLEAMSTACPVVYSKRSSGPETLEDSISGFLCDPYNPEDLAQKILLILSNVQLMENFGTNARNRVLSNFDKNQWIKTNLDFYGK